jgi:hypothetical protein
MTRAFLTIQTPGSSASTVTVRPANSFPKEIWPLAPDGFHFHPHDYMMA